MCCVASEAFRCNQGRHLRSMECKQRSALGLSNAKCAKCKEYPVLAEEACEDAGAKLISFHVYKYKVSLHKDGKEH